MNPIFFETRTQLREWFEANHDSAEELWVGLYKKGGGKPTVTWPEVVDEALCFGWIDGIRKRVDDTSYMNRLTTRRKRSNWSDRNVDRMAELDRQGLVHAAGRAAFEAGRPGRKP